MVIHIWADGSWKYDWEVSALSTAGSRAVDLDRWYEYNLDEREVLACLNAVEKAEEIINA